MKKLLQTNYIVVCLMMVTVVTSCLLAFDMAPFLCERLRFYEPWVRWSTFIDLSIATQMAHLPIPLKYPLRFEYKAFERLALFNSFYEKHIDWEPIYQIDPGEEGRLHIRDVMKQQHPWQDIYHQDEYILVVASYARHLSAVVEDNSPELTRWMLTAAVRIAREDGNYYVDLARWYTDHQMVEEAEVILERCFAQPSAVSVCREQTGRGK